MRSATPQPLRLALVTALLGAGGAWAGEPVPDIDIILEQNPGGVVAECTPPNCPDDWVIGFTRDFASAMSPVDLPQGWTFEVDGKKVLLKGPAPDRPTRFRFDVGEAKRPGKISYRASLQGRTLVDVKKLAVTPVAPRQQIGSLRGIVTMPAEVAPGEPMKMQVNEGAGLPAGGTWSLSGVVVDDEERKDGTTTLFSSNYNSTRSNKKTASSAIAASDGTVTFDALPEDLQPGSTISMRYIDKFGDVLVDVPAVPNVEVVAPGGGGGARITGATARALAGQSVCVCGTFPGEAAWNGVLLDGQSAGSPRSASGRLIWLQLPADLAPGEHGFTGTAAAGFPATDRASTLVLQVGGEIDSSKLKKLETTPMRLWVAGTEEPVDLRVRNLTPAIISIEGGVDQTIRTSGGAHNMLERTVQGLAPGAFDIQYELAGESCPCGAPADSG